MRSLEIQWSVLTKHEQEYLVGDKERNQASLVKYESAIFALTDAIGALESASDNYMLLAR